MKDLVWQFLAVSVLFNLAALIYIVANWWIKKPID